MRRQVGQDEARIHIQLEEIHGPGGIAQIVKDQMAGTKRKIGRVKRQCDIAFADRFLEQARIAEDIAKREVRHSFFGMTLYQG